MDLIFPDDPNIRRAVKAQQECKRARRRHLDDRTRNFVRAVNFLAIRMGQPDVSAAEVRAALDAAGAGYKARTNAAIGDFFGANGLRLEGRREAGSTRYAVPEGGITREALAGLGFDLSPAPSKGAEIYEVLPFPDAASA